MGELCVNSGQELQDGARFCPSDGTKVVADNAPLSESEPLENIDYRGERVRLCKDGKYRWVYEMNMLTNPTIFLTVFKVFAGIVIGMFLVFGFFLYVIHGDWNGLLDMAKAMLLVMAIFTGLTILGVLLVAIIYKGKYIVLFEMDDKKVSHIQVPEQFKKAQKLGAITAMAGAARGNLTMAGSGMLAASKNASTSIFYRVRRVKPRRWLHVIKVNQRLNKNQVYVTNEDFDFVYHYIKSHCPNAK